MEASSSAHVSWSFCGIRIACMRGSMAEWTCHLGLYRTTRIRAHPGPLDLKLKLRCVICSSLWSLPVD